MEEDWGVKPPLDWATIGSVEEVAKKFNVIPFTVRRIMREIEVSKKKELEVKIDFRMNRATEFLRHCYDEEAKNATCPDCGREGFDTLDELVAHVRVHLMMADLNDHKAASTAQRVAADLDKLMYPQYKMSLRQRREGILPPDEDPIELAKRVDGRLGPGKS